MTDEGRPNTILKILETASAANGQVADKRIPRQFEDMPVNLREARINIVSKGRRNL